MTKMKSLSLSLSVAAIFAASPSLAQVTAAEIWAEWQAQSAAMNQPLSADGVSETADGLVITGLTSTFEDPTASAEAVLDEVILTENSDGTVSISVSSPYRITSRATPEFGAEASFAFEIGFEGLEITASGTPDNRRYDYVADRITMTDAGMTIDGTEAPELSIDMSVTDIRADYILIGDNVEDMRVTSDSEFASAGGTIEVDGPETDPGNFKMSFSMGATSSTSAMTLASIAAMAGGAQSLPENFDLTGDATYERLSYEAAFEGPGEAFNMAFANQGGEIAIEFTPGGLTYDLSGEGVEARVLTSQFPVPITISAASTGFLITVPMAPEEEPSDMALVLDYQGLEINEEIWGMFDPGGAIPRDPANLLIDMTGTAQMFVNLLNADPVTMQGPPGELRSATLNELDISAAGARLEGDGELEFAPGQIVPMPVGTIDLRLAGMNGLLDRLTGAGLLPMEQAAMARGVAGMFARPGATMDTLETTVEFLPGGQITANGIPLQ